MDARSNITARAHAPDHDHPAWKAFCDLEGKILRARDTANVLAVLSEMTIERKDYQPSEAETLALGFIAGETVLCIGHVMDEWTASFDRLWGRAA